MTHVLTVSWMNTGDAELLAKSDLEDWKKCYATDLAHIAALALPHHGSDKNSGEPLQALCPNASLLAHASAKRGKRPGANVTLAADERLCCVTEHFDAAANMFSFSHEFVPVERVANPPKKSACLRWHPKQRAYRVFRLCYHRYRSERAFGFWRGTAAGD
jgi:hypothetical protein